MKRYMIVVCSIAAMLSFAGCSRESSSSMPEVSLPPASLSILEEPSSSVLNPENTGGLADPASTSAEELIEPAMEVSSWFALGSMPLASESRTAINPITGEEDTFQRVDSPYFSNYEGLKNYLSHFFSDEIIEHLLEEYPVCMDIDGTLYMIPTCRGANIFIKDAVFSTEEVTDTSARLSAAISYDPDAGELENPKTYEFVCQKIDGKWVFTTFEYYL